MIRTLLNTRNGVVTLSYRFVYIAAVITHDSYLRYREKFELLSAYWYLISIKLYFIGLVSKGVRCM